jgi:hypothetical protein
VAYSAYRTCLAWKVRNFLSGRTPGEGDQEHQHCAAMRLAWGSACHEHATATNVEALAVRRLRPHKPGGNNLSKVAPEDLEDSLSSPNFRSRSAPIRATP